MAHSATFNATSRCGNVLQVFESDSKICNIIARIYEKDNRAVLQMFAYWMSCETWITWIGVKIPLVFLKYRLFKGWITLSSG